jgi:gliding motility-associated-like protein
MKKIILIILFLFGKLFAQTINNQVINSAGGTKPVGSTGITITDNVGEPFVQTLGPASNIMITQGFLQPDLVSVLGPTASIIKNDVSCTDKKDGNISIALSNTSPSVLVQYVWTPSTVCPTGNCSRLDSLPKGTYIVKIILTGGTKIDSILPAPIIINDLNGPCKVKIYNAITANDDGINDFFVIENISDFPKNRVTIYDRWGQQLADINGYNNVDKIWPAKNNNNVISSTYFYVIDLGDGGKAIKGWLELLSN